MTRSILKAAGALSALVILMSCGPSEDRLAPFSETVNIATPYDPDTLDPHARDLVGNFAVVSNFYEPLVRLDARMKLLPCLASSWENPDPLSWRFHLREGVRFHSKKLLSSRDVVYSLERLLRSDTLEMRAYLSGVSGVIAEDAQTVRILTNHPVNLLPNKLSFVHIVPEGSTDQTMAGTVDGTGPYILKSWERGKMIRLQSFQEYWGKPADLSSVNLFLDTAPEAAIKGLPGKTFQLVQINSKQLEPAVRKLNDYELIRNDTLFVSYLSFDLSRQITPNCTAVPNPFKNLKVRQAIHLALDRNALVDRLVVYASPATQPLPPFVFGFNPAIGLPAHDPEQARRLMADAGYEKGFDVTLDSSKALEPAAQILREQLQGIGIHVSVRAMPASEYYRTLGNGDSSLFLSSYGCVTGDASDYLEEALHSRDSAHRFGGTNFGRYLNPEADRLIEQSGNLQKAEDRLALLKDIQDLAMQDLPWIPLFIEQEMYALDKRFSWQPRSDGFILVQEVSLRRQKR